MDKELTREELFLLVWEKPSTEVAKGLGISDVALGKRCKQLQVPKPPPGYWAKVQSGKRPRKPLLREFSEKIAEQQKRKKKGKQEASGWTALSPLQYEIMSRALSEFEAGGGDLSRLKLSRSGVRVSDGDLVAQIIILIQTRYLHWLKERAGSDRIAHPSISSVQSLVKKILPLSSSHTLLLSKKRDKHDSGDKYPKIIIRLTPEFRQQVANLHRLVTENGLSYAVWNLKAWEHAWLVQYHYHYDDFVSAKSQLCVSASSLWILSEVNLYRWHDDNVEVIETEKLPLKGLVPVDLLPPEEVEVPAHLEESKLLLSEKRIKAFVEAEHAYDIISTAIYRHDIPTPDEHLVLLEKFVNPSELEGPLTSARKLCRQLEEDFERFESAMDAERREICSEALGLKIGDTVISESRGKSVKLKISNMSAHIYEDNTLNFWISGLRYRKDGTLGKREDSIYLSTKSVRAE